MDIYIYIGAKAKVNEMTAINKKINGSLYRATAIYVIYKYILNATFHSSLLLFSFSLDSHRNLTNGHLSVLL